MVYFATILYKVSVVVTGGVSVCGVMAGGGEVLGAGSWALGPLGPGTYSGPLGPLGPLETRTAPGKVETVLSRVTGTQVVTRTPAPRHSRQ